MRGITVCSEWVDDFDRFYDDMGECPATLTLERKDNDLGYSKDNCKWASVRDQLNNQRRNVRVSHQGRVQTVGQWAMELGIHYDTLHKRLKNGMRPEDAFVLVRPAKEWSHGTRRKYDLGCRCAECKAFNAARARAARKNRNENHV